jgi:hypothetical protein
MRGQLFEISPAEAQSDFVKGFMFEHSHRYREGTQQRRVRGLDNPVVFSGPESLGGKAENT